MIDPSRLPARTSAISIFNFFSSRVWEDLDWINVSRKNRSCNDGNVFLLVMRTNARGMAIRNKQNLEFNSRIVEGVQQRDVRYKSCPNIIDVVSCITHAIPSSLGLSAQTLVFRQQRI